MNKLLSCRYNMDTNRVEARFADGSAVAIDCVAIEDSTATPLHSGLNWSGCCATGRWSTHSLCWEERWSTISRWDATTAGWKIKSL